MSKVTDPIADMLTRIRNACKAKFTKVDIPSSKMKKQIANVLLEQNYIKNLVEVQDNRQNLLRLYLRYDAGNRSLISGLSRVSKSGLRIYVKSEDLKKMTRSMGIFIVSTSKGILTHHQAIRENLGGELLCKIW
jgi:small subunit ribosomal protein S8